MSLEKLVKKNAVIFDIDGVLTDSMPYIFKYLRHTDKKNYKAFWKAIPNMTPNKWALELTHMFHAFNYDIILLTARQDIPVARKNTIKWMYKNKVPFSELFMQPPRDKSVKDNVYKHGDIKLDIYKNQIEPFYNILLMIDDSPSNVKVFRDYGLTVLQPNHEDDV